MFWHLYHYLLKRLLRNGALSFWTFVFPLFLGTIFYFSFGRAFENTEVFKATPVAVVLSEETNEGFATLLDELSKEDGLLNVTVMTAEDAKQSLSEGAITGIYFMKETPELVVDEKGISASILNIVLEQYLQSEHTVMTVFKTYPEKVEEVITSMSKEITHVVVTNQDAGNMNIYLQYFYALLAMSALYASFLGLAVVEQIQPDLSDVGQRRAVAPANKMLALVAEFAAALTIEIMVNIITLFYFIQVLKLDFGSKIPQIALILIVGNAFGIAMGICIESLPIRNHSIKFGLAIVSTMVMSFLSGLMFDKMRNIIENACPILNRLNPAALIVDSFYCLNIYDTYERYGRNLLTLVSFTVVLCVITFFVTRRNRYASL